MSIYRYLKIVEIIEKESIKRQIRYKRLAESAQIHSSYFSRVISGHAHFSQEQLYLIGKGFSFEDEELNYFLLLGEFEASGNSQHQKFLKLKIETIRKEKNKVINDLQNIKNEFSHSNESLEKYYEDSLTTKVHIYLTLENYRTNPKAIANRLRISDDRLRQELLKLEKLKIISQQQNKIQLLTENIHLDGDHPLSKKNHLNWRLEVLDSIRMPNNSNTDYHLSVAFSANSETKLAIRELFRDFVVKAQKIVIQTEPSDKVYYMTFDLFKQSQRWPRSPVT